MAPFLAGTFGNPSGGHAAARAAKTALEDGPRRGRRPPRRRARRGRVHRRRHRGRQPRGQGRRPHASGPAAGRDGVVTTAFEHKGVLASCDRLAAEGFRVTRLPVPDHRRRRPRVGRGRGRRRHRAGLGDAGQQRGRHDPAARRHRSSGPRGRARPCWSTPTRSRRCRGSTSPRPRSTPIWWRSRPTSSAVPKGTGALVVRRGVAARAVDRRRWSGARAAVRHVQRRRRGRDGGRAARHVRRARRRRRTDRARCATAWSTACSATVPDAFENGDRAAKVAGNAHVGFRGVEAETLLVALDRADVCAAAGSSCSSGATEPSHVLAAMGDHPRRRRLVDPALSLGFASTDHDVDVALAVIPRAVEQLRRGAASVSERVRRA